MNSLEISVRSASGLKDLNTVGTMDPYVVVSLSSDTSSKQKTKVHTDGGTNPQWRGKPMKFSINQDVSKMQNVTLVFKIMAEKPFGDKEVGVVNVPIKELLQGDVEKSLSYSVTMPSGKPKGTLNFSYKVVRNATAYDPINVPGAYGTSMVVGPGPSSCYGVPGPGSYPPPNSHPQYGAAPSPYPSQQPQHFQQPGVYYPPPSQGYPPQQGYGYPPGGAPPPQGAYGYPQGGAPPPPGQYGYPPVQGPGYPSSHGNQHQMKHGGKKPKSKAGGLLGLGALGIGAGLLGGMLLGDVVPDIGDMASGFGDALGGAAGDVGSAFEGAYTDAGNYYGDVSSSMDTLGSIG